MREEGLQSVEDSDDGIGDGIGDVIDGINASQEL